MGVTIGDFFNYEGVQDLREDGELHRLVFDDELFSASVFTNSDFLENIYALVTLEDKKLHIKSGDKSFDIKKGHVDFSFRDSPIHIYPLISLTLDSSNYQYYSELIKPIGSIIDKSKFKIFCVLWGDEVIKKDETVTRGNLSSWRNEILKDGKCACCGGDKYLEAHHIFSYNSYPKLRDDVSNGVPLCKWCHKKLHSYYGKEPTPL